MRSGDFKLVGEKGRLSLFDLSQDVSESNDLAARLPEKVAELTRRHDAWLAEMAEPVKAGAKRYDLAPAKADGSEPAKKKRKREEKQEA